MAQVGLLGTFVFDFVKELVACSGYYLCHPFGVVEVLELVAVEGQ